MNKAELKYCLHVVKSGKLYDVNIVDVEKEALDEESELGMICEYGEV